MVMLVSDDLETVLYLEYYKKNAPALALRGQLVLHARNLVRVGAHQPKQWEHNTS